MGDMGRMKILYHHRTQGRGAEGNHIVSIVTALRAAGHDVDVLSPPGVDPFDRARTLPVDTLKGQATGWAWLWRTLSLRLPGALFEIAELAYNVPAYLRLRRALAGRRYDVVFERYASFLAAGSVAARRYGCRYVVEINDVSGVADRVRPQYLPRLCSAVERWILSRCDLAHAVSSYLGERLEELGVPRERIVVAPNGFDVSRVTISESRDTMRRRYGLEDSLVIGFAGWFVPWDRLDFLVEVFAAARSEVPELKLCLVGDGEPARELVQRARGTPLEEAIVMTGAVPRDRVFDHIQMFDIGVLPHSNLFGSPVVMFEMMGLRVPLLMPALPPICDVHKDGETALLFSPLDADECKRGMLQLALSSDLRTRLAANSYARLNSQHTWLHTAERILAAFYAASQRGGAHTEIASRMEAP